MELDLDRLFEVIQCCQGFLLLPSLLTAEQLLPDIAKLHLRRLLSRLQMRGRDQLFLALPQIALAWEECAAEAIRWMSLLEDTAGARRDWVRIHAEGIGLRSCLCVITRLLSDFLCCGWVICTRCTYLKLLVMMALPWVMRCHMMVIFLAARDGRGGTPTTVNSLKLRGVVVLRCCHTLSIGTLLERTHVRATESTLIFVCICIRCSTFLRRYVLIRSTIGSKIVIKHYIIVVLLHIISQVKMFGKKAHQFVTRSIIGNLRGLSLHFWQHGVEKFATISTSLNTSVNKEIENGKRFHLNHFASSTPDK